MPDTAKIAQRGPYIVEAGPGTVYWCQCGRSKTQPFCDGSHTGTDFAPLEIHLNERKRLAFCGCKRTKSPPYCDDTHSTL
jgi:CDGSH iron-sulfur domain-containing protein 3